MRRSDRKAVGSSRVSRPRRLAVLGIGNELNGDDAAGVLVARALRDGICGSVGPGSSWTAPTLDGHFLVIEAGLAPENFTGTLRRFHPELVLLVDAAELGQPPGTVAWVGWAEAGGWSGSTHTLPPSVLAHYLVEELSCEVILVGIQPARLDFGAGVSAEVQQAITEVAGKIRDLAALGESNRLLH